MGSRRAEGQEREFPDARVAEPPRVTGMDHKENRHSRQRGQHKERRGWREPLMTGETRSQRGVYVRQKAGQTAGDTAARESGHDPKATGSQPRRHRAGFEFCSDLSIGM